ncbi:ribosomal subunit interface protein [Candidatus Berkelbacteria bacterium CG08_land_8_20_14_0_20_39_8]|uniref:Ribosomal subunit interface protein n=1 Tax=Candidatus Berkelbacteria bacterium CG08_land_8_20_14_0_20_39_8 TaxID=1974511 RepID=A0A2M6YBP3_9BACT|nr:MAG: ribosomal subunit interface protein [Candidatus Berkelbacteria bacterium CG08_land_8_20_14_0_20_39_8]
MQINVVAKDVIITARQKSYIEKKISRLKKYLKHESPVSVEVHLVDDSGPNKDGVTQTVKVNVRSEHYNIHIEEKKNNIMKAFTNALKSVDRQVRDQHKKEIQKTRKAGQRGDKVFGILKKFRRKK